MNPQEQNILANLAVKSMTDQQLRHNLINDTHNTLLNAGIELGADPPNIIAIADTELLFNVIVPLTPLPASQQLLTLPLPHPTPFLIMVWIMTNVQNNTELAPKLLTDPVAVLKDMGVSGPENVVIKVWRETESTRYLGLPYAGSTTSVPQFAQSAAAKSKSPSHPNVNINVNVNANVEVNAVTLVNAAAVANVEAALQVSSALVAAEVIVVLVI